MELPGGTQLLDRVGDIRLENSEHWYSCWLSGPSLRCEERTGRAPAFPDRGPPSAFGAREDGFSSYAHTLAMLSDADFPVR